MSAMKLVSIEGEEQRSLPSAVVEVERLDKSLSVLADALTELSERVTPLLVGSFPPIFPPQGQSKAASPSTAPAVSAHVSHLVALLDVVSVLTTRVRDLTASIQL